MINMNSTISMVDTRSSYNPGAWEVLEEALNNKRLTFQSGSFFKMGLGSMEEIEQAVDRAITICCNNGLSLEEHFKTIYISDRDNHSVSRDWKLSRLAYTLVLININSDNPLIGRMQLELLNAYLEKSEGQNRPATV
jgi:hypothetical protein